MPLFISSNASTHDMSSFVLVEEDRVKTQRFFNNEMGQWGDAPYHCDALDQQSHCAAASQFACHVGHLPMQDLLGMDDAIAETIRMKNVLMCRLIPKLLALPYAHKLEQLLKERTQ